jgi:MarR family transcriptional regulator, organic hydroperoxide resistance regulator
MSSTAENDHRKELMNQLQFLGQMSSTETALFHQKAAAKMGLGITDMKTISTLIQEGRMTAGQLAQRLSLTTGAITSVIDRLEKHGIVKRKTDPSDRRKVFLEVEKTKIKKAENIYESVGRRFGTLLSGYSTEELEFLVRHYKAAIENTKLEITQLTTNSTDDSK